MAKVENINVYARVSPEQELRIVKTLQSKGHYVAMTGDGINDAPSLKKANIGIAMGITSTHITKKASDMILLDDNFSSIVKAGSVGWRIYDNILKFIKYQITSNSSGLWTLLPGANNQVSHSAAAHTYFMDKPGNGCATRNFIIF
jgi:Ca2+-transporting ATPase